MGLGAAHPGEAGAPATVREAQVPGMPWSPGPQAAALTQQAQKGGADQE